MLTCAARKLVLSAVHISLNSQGVRYPLLLDKEMLARLLQKSSSGACSKMNILYVRTCVRDSVKYDDSVIPFLIAVSLFKLLYH